MLSLLGWLPVIGPIIDGITTVFKGITDAKVTEYKTDAGVYQAQLTATNQITLAFINDIAVRLARDIVMFPGSVWCGLVIWDKIVEIRYPWLVWGVKPLVGVMAYLPYALMTFFFGSSWLTTSSWNKK